jgi:hypothetical protein
MTIWRHRAMKKRGVCMESHEESSSSPYSLVSHSNGTDNSDISTTRATARHCDDRAESCGVSEID